MTQSRPDRDAESQWQQPPFDPGEQTREPVPGSIEFFEPSRDQVLVPAQPRRPPSVLESILNVVNSVLWPVLLGLALFGVGNWWLNVVAAIIATALIGGIRNELRRHRKYLPPGGVGE